MGLLRWQLTRLKTMSVYMASGWLLRRLWTLCVRQLKGGTNVGINELIRQCAGSYLAEIEKLDDFIERHPRASLRKFKKWAMKERLSMPLFEKVLALSFVGERGVFAAWKSQCEAMLGPAGAEMRAKELMAAPLSAGSDELLSKALRGEIVPPGPKIGMSLKEMSKEYEVTHVRWVAEEGACPGCASLNGCLFTILEAEAFIDGRKHSGCRCRWEPVYGFKAPLKLCPQGTPLTLFSKFCEAAELFQKE